MCLSKTGPVKLIKNGYGNLLRLFWESGETEKKLYTATQFTIDKIWNQTKCSSTDDYIKKLWNIYLVEYYSDAKKE